MCIRDSSIPTGICITKGFAPSLSFIISTHLKKSAPVLSNLLTKQILGTLYLSACRQTVSDWGSTPATPSNTATAPSKTLRDLSTSIVNLHVLEYQLYLFGDLAKNKL